MRRLSAARTTAPEATSATTHQMRSPRVIGTPPSVPDHQRHAGAPEGELFGKRADRERVDASADASEITQLPAESYPVRQKAGRAAAHVDGRQRFSHGKHVVEIVDARVHQAKPADSVRSKRIGGHMPRNPDDDVSGQRGDAAPRNQMQSAWPEKTRHVAKVRFDPDDVAEQSAADAGHDV